MSRKPIVFGISILLFATATFASGTSRGPVVQLSPQIQRALDRSGRTVTHSHNKNGMQVAEHNGSFQNVMFSRLATDGSIEYFCTDNLETAQAWLSEPATSTKRLPRPVRPESEVK